MGHSSSSSPHPKNHSAFYRNRVAVTDAAKFACQRARSKERFFDARIHRQLQLAEPSTSQSHAERWNAVCDHDAVIEATLFHVMTFLALSTCVVVLSSPEYSQSGNLSDAVLVQILVELPRLMTNLCRFSFRGIVVTERRARTVMIFVPSALSFPTKLA